MNASDKSGLVPIMHMTRNDPELSASSHWATMYLKHEVGDTTLIWRRCTAESERAKIRRNKWVALAMVMTTVAMAPLTQ